MAGILRGWHADPFGVHELRYFTFDGNPTRLVRDGAGWSHDPPPVATHPSVVHTRISRHDGDRAFHEEGYLAHGELRESHVTPLVAVSQMAVKEPVGESPAVTSDVPSSTSPTRRATLRRLLRYSSVSVVSTVIGLSLLGLFVGVLRWPATWSNVIAVGIATVPSFELNRRWVWAQDGPRSILRQAVPYFLLSFAGLVMSTIAVHLASDATIHSSRLVHTAAVELANIAAYGSLWVIQFVLCDRILFRPRANSPDGAAWSPVVVGMARAPGAPVPSEVMA
jgi:putative flippase GtrA